MRTNKTKALGAVEGSSATPAFLLEEWKATREQVHLLLGAIWRIESTAILGLGAFYAWFYSRGEGIWLERYILMVTGQSESSPLFMMACLASVPAIFSLIIILRLKIEYGILTCLSDYTILLEDHFYRYAQVSTTIRGWESYLAERNPDKMTFYEVRQRYSNTFNGFIFIVIVCALIALVNWFRFFVSLEWDLLW